MTKYTKSLLIFTLILFTIITSTAKPRRCKTEGHVEFFPDFNKDDLYGVIKFTETGTIGKIIVTGIFSTVVGGVDGIKTKDGKPLYTAELYDKKGTKLYDLTAPVFDNA